MRLMIAHLSAKLLEYVNIASAAQEVVEDIFVHYMMVNMSLTNQSVVKYAKSAHHK